MKGRRAVVAVVFLFFFFSGYAIMGYTRHYLYDLKVQKHVADCVFFRQQAVCRNWGWETHEYLGTPQGALVVADPVFREEIYSLCDVWLEYATGYNIEVLPSILKEVSDGKKWNLWDAYQEITVFNYLKIVLGTAPMMGTPIIPYNKLDRGGSLAEAIASWESTGGKREGNWMEVYKHSPEYEAWLSNLFEEITNPRGTRREGYNPTSMEDRYKETTRVVELPFCSSLLLQEDMMQADQKMVEVAYKRYLTHVSEKDIIRTDIDAWIVDIGASNFNYDAGIEYTLLHVLRMRWFPLRDLILDACVIIGSSFALTFIVARWGLPRVENRSKGTRSEEDGTG